LRRREPDLLEPLERKKTQREGIKERETE